MDRIIKTTAVGKKKYSNTHFCLTTNENDTYKNRYTAFFSGEKPENYIEIGKIEWKVNDKKISLYMLWDEKCQDTNNNDKKYGEDIKLNFALSDLPILRSQLQKCVRRKNYEIGMKTAISMTLLDEIDKKTGKIKQTGLFELLRRITIIIIEDSVLLYDYILLVWFLCALSKGIILKDTFINVILEIVNKVMASDWKDKSYSTEGNRKDLVDTLTKSQDIPKQIKNLLMSLQLRNSFHGMDQDVQMLNQSTICWNRRFLFKRESTQHLDPVVINEIDHVGLQRNEIILEALDHHCTDIVQRVKSHIDIFENSLIEHLIWEFSSSINTRLNIEPIFSNNDKLDKLKEIQKKQWDIIKNIVQMEMLQIKDNFISSYKYIR